MPREMSKADMTPDLAAVLSMGILGMNIVRDEWDTASYFMVIVASYLIAVLMVGSAFLGILPLRGSRLATYHGTGLSLSATTALLIYVLLRFAAYQIS